jgi:hypothetical protein
LAADPNPGSELSTRYRCTVVNDFLAASVSNVDLSQAFEGPLCGTLDRSGEFQLGGSNGRYRAGISVVWPSVKGTSRVFTTVRYPVLQFNAVKKQFVATRKVSPAASFHEWKSANERNAIR